MTQTAKKVADIEEVPEITVRRLTNMDLEKHKTWLFPRLQEHFEIENTTILAGWVRSWMLGNEYNLACTDNSIALATIGRDPLNPTPVIQEVFLFVPEGHEKEGIALYKHFMRWGRSMRAKEFVFNKVSGKHKEYLQAELPGFRWRTCCYIGISQ